MAPGEPTIRAAGADDALAIAVAHVRSWRSAYRGLIAQEVLDALDPQERAARYVFDRSLPDGPYTLIAEAAGTVLAHVTVGRSSEDPSLGEVWSLYVDPGHWRSGTGRALLRAGSSALAAAGFDAAVLWVLEGNTKASSFYEADGWRADGRRRTVEIGDAAVSELCFRRMLDDPRLWR
ncbi:N-acetyltransferase family protein [Gordonia aichiensis]